MSPPSPPPPPSSLPLMEYLLADHLTICQKYYFAINNLTKLDANHYAYGNILPGSEVFGPVSYNNPNMETIAKTSPEFNHTLIAAVAHPALGIATFGDKGFDTPGFGGIGKYSVVKLTADVNLTTIGNFVDGTHWDNSTFGAACQPWWSVKEDSDGMTLTESQDKVSQTNFNVSQIMQCTFGRGTRLIVGDGNWRATLRDLTYCGQWNSSFVPGCTTSDGRTFSNPQKVVDSRVKQYLIPLGLSEHAKYICAALNFTKCEERIEEIGRLSPVKVIGACMVCMIDTENLTNSFNNPTRCQKSPFYNNFQFSAMTRKFSLASTLSQRLSFNIESSRKATISGA